MMERSEGHADSVPRSTLAVVARLPIGQTANVLRMLVAAPEAADLVETNPGISVCLAAAFAFAQTVGSSPQFDWLHQKRRTICRRLGFPDEERSVRILAKVRPECAMAWRLREIREPLHQPALAKLLSHVPVIHTGHLIVAARLWDAAVITYSQFEQLANWRSERAVEGFCATLADTVWLRRQTGESPVVFRSIAQLLNSHERVVKSLGRVGPSEADPMQLPYPSPPLISPTFEPITSPPELKEEGRIMNHCVFQYSRDVTVGRRYFYRQTSPNRATIGLIKRSGRWAVFDVRTKGNERVNAEIADSISTWVEQAENQERRSDAEA